MMNEKTNMPQNHACHSTARIVRVKTKSRGSASCDVVTSSSIAHAPAAPSASSHRVRSPSRSYACCAITALIWSIRFRS